MIAEKTTLTPLPGFQALDGCHCVTASFRKVCVYNGYPVSEEMLLGLGAGAGFVYWHTGGQLPFLGGRGNHPDFHTDLARRTGLTITEHASASPRAAERALLRLLDAGQPVVIYADMPYLTYLGLPPEAHFGGHAVVVAGYDAAARQVLIADLAARETGVKTGSLNPLSFEQLALARGSTHPPFPPRNRWFTFDFTNARPPTAEDVRAAIQQAAQAMLHSPIQNLGVKGIRTAARRALDWPNRLDAGMLRLALFNAYVYVEIGGTGGGLFRLMYGRFLQEAAALLGDGRLADTGAEFERIGRRWSEVAAPLAGAFEHPAPHDLLPAFAAGLHELHDLEAQAWGKLEEKD